MTIKSKFILQSIASICIIFSSLDASTLKKSPNLLFKKALILGVGGQDGFYLAQFLLEKGYEVHGLKHKTSSFMKQPIDELYQNNSRHGESKIFLHHGDITDSLNIVGLIQSIQPDEIYNLAGESNVKVSFESPISNVFSNAIGALYVLEAIRILELKKKIRVYQATSSEMYGKVQQIPQDEKTPFDSLSPYATAKQFTFWITKNYREVYGIFACSGILFNHESPIRSERFVTRKITRSVALIKHGLIDSFSIGNLEARRDWGHARDYVESMWLMLQKDRPDDYVIATGQVHSVREFIEVAFAEIGIKIKWKGSDLNEVGFDANTGNKLVFIDQKHFRPVDVNLTVGNPEKAKNQLDWRARTLFHELVKEMIEHDLKDIESLIKKSR